MTSNSTNNVKRRGIVYVYGFEWCNPNGDPTFDNEPRIFNGKLYVTDVFLKRRLRDYVDSSVEDKESFQIFVKEEIKSDGSRKTPEERLREICNITDNQSNLNVQTAKDTLIKKCWDIRVFGCMIPLPQASGNGGEEKGKAIKLIGPVQASFGISLNEVEKLDVSITNVLATEKEAKGGAIGRKYVVPVAIVEHYIFVNDVSAKETGMSEEDYSKLLEGLRNLKLSPTLSTSSKNSTPILIAEVLFGDNKYANLSGLIEVSAIKEFPLVLRDYILDCSKLIQKINELSNNQGKKVIEDFKFYIKSEFYDIVRGLDGISQDKLERF